jgi:antitoxin CptB
MKESQIRWACRRGMLELDLMLEAYLDKGWPVCDDAAKLRFEILLDENDQDLFEWLMGRSLPEDATLQQAVRDVLAVLR